MKTIVLFLLLAFGIGIAVPAAATAQTVSHTVLASSSAPCLGSQVKGSEGSGPSWETEWLKKDGTCIQQGAVKCENEARNHVVWYHGGWVSPLLKWSEVNCSPSYPIPVQGNINWTEPGWKTYWYKKLWPA